MGSNTYKRTSASVIGCFGLSEQFLSSKFSTEWSRFLDLAPPFICMVWSFHFAANERWCRLLVAQGIQFQFVILYQVPKLVDIKGGEPGFDKFRRLLCFLRFLLS